MSLERVRSHTRSRIPYYSGLIFAGGGDPPSVFGKVDPLEGSRVPRQAEYFLPTGRIKYGDSSFTAPKSNARSVRAKNDWLGEGAFRLKPENFPATGGIPRYGRGLFPTDAKNPLTIRRKARTTRVPAGLECHQGRRLDLPLPVVPFETAIR